MCRIALVAVAAACAGTAACAAPLADDAPVDRPHRANADVDWRDQVIYQIVTDRFANGDASNDYAVEPGTPARYHGGDWRGIRDHLDYLEHLGVTTLWISPVVRNLEEDAGFAAYHGYWTQDPLRVNPHFGDLVALRDLVDAAHERGMLVILDVVLNHMGQLFYYDINGNGRPDDWLTGGGTPHTCVQICNNPARADECSPDERTYCAQAITYLERISEFDPEYDPRGIQGWTSGGFSGPADIRFFYDPARGATPPARPPDWFGWPDDRAWFDDPAWYSRRGRVYVWWHEDDYTDEFVRDQETRGDFVGGLRDLDTDHPDVRDALVRAYAYWIAAADFDGFRIDTLKHMDRPERDRDVRGMVGTFATRIREEAAALGKHNFFLLGEVFDGDDELAGAYTFGGRDADGPFGRVDSVLYFSQKYRVVDEVFKRGAPTRNVECLYAARMGVPASDDGYCAANGFPAGPTYAAEPHAMPADGGIGLPPNRVLVNFLDNHDVPRFLFPDTGVAALHNALFFLMTWDGIPAIYYGTEQQFAGGTDPKNREDMVFDEGGDTFRWLAALIALRKQHVALRRGDVRIAWATDRPRGARDSGILAFERTHPDETLLVVLNTADEQTSRTCAPDADGGACMPVSFPPGTVLTDIAPGGDGATFTVAADGTVDVDVPARGGRVLAP
ncbi:MAG: alpha-amylase [Deltaproteobacteria bacterium]|nr:MAG: alpha-amylase [Deltaproteobacteria bacterium]